MGHATRADRLLIRSPTKHRAGTGGGMRTDRPQDTRTVSWSVGHDTAAGTSLAPSPAHTPDADTVFDGLRLGLLRRLEGWLIPSVGRWTGKEVTDFCLEVLEIAKGHSRAWTARRRRRARRRKAANDELVSCPGDPALVGAL